MVHGTPPPRRARVHAGNREDEVYAHLAGGIRASRWQPGENLPSLRALAVEFTASINTVHRALRRLSDEGTVVVAHGSGTRVASPASSAATALARPLVALIGAIPAPDQPTWRALGMAYQQWLLHHLAADARLRLSLGATAPGVANGLPTRLAEARAEGARVIVMLDEAFDSPAYRAVVAMRAAGTRIALVAASHEFRTCDRVEGDFAGGQRALTVALATGGHRVALRLAMHERPWWEQRREAGFAVALRELGEGAPERRTVRIDADLSDRSARIAHIAAALRPALAKTRATAVMALSDADVGFTRAALARLGRADVVVAGYDATWPELRRIGLLESWARESTEDGRAMRIDEAPISVDRDLPALASALAGLVGRRALGLLPDDNQRLLIEQRVLTP